MPKTIKLFILFINSIKKQLADQQISWDLKINQGELIK